MSEIIIDEEFRFLLPALDDETYARLEEDLLKNGCRDALVLWNNIIIDGYNRYSICTKHNIEFKTIDMEFDSREDVLIWIISNQVSRRNLTPIQLSHYRGVHYRAERKSQSDNSRYAQKNAKRQNGVLQKSTAKQLAEKYKVSSRTIDRDSKTADAIDAIGEVSSEAKRKILAGEMKINRKILKDLPSMQANELSDFVAKIEDGTFDNISSKAYQTEKSQETTDSVSSSEKKQTLDAIIKKITNNEFFDLQELSKSKVSAKAKAALRNHIDMLEELYKRI